MPERLKEVFDGIAEQYELEIDTMEDYVHVLLGEYAELQPMSTGTDTQERLGTTAGIPVVSRSERADARSKAV